MKKKRSFTAPLGNRALSPSAKEAATVNNDVKLPIPLTDDPLLTGKEVCRILRITPRTLYRKRVAKQLTGIPVSERRYLYRTSAIRRYLEMAEARKFNPFAIDGR